MKVLPFTILYPDNKSVIAERIEQPHFYPHLHRHDEYQLTLVERGEGMLLAGNNMHAFKAGDVFLIGSNLPHLFKSNPEFFAADSGKSIKASSLYFNIKGTIGGLFNLPEMKVLKTWLQANQHGFKTDIAQCPELPKLIKSVHDAVGLDALHRFLDVFTSLQNLRHTERLCPADYSADLSESEGMRLGRILHFVMQRYHTHVTLDEVAAVAYMTPQAFCRYFKRHTGRSFVTFLNEVRINEACKSLTQTVNPDGISEAAYKAGFNSITNFNRVFKSVKGRSPRAYLAEFQSVNTYQGL
ncbi:AraC family transcriptional regulator [Chitinophaga caseinilytica]|uniref:AraC family transcriptional regulator n=1 Tax=Chitinophaga caseinilytica TaxID=2267521 RepID=A0ABZ2Z9G1_9BACT